jgi:Ca2+-binding RTX toxin-like protein
MTFTYTGTSGNDNYDYKGSDSLLAYGLAGNDTLRSYESGNSTIVGGVGNDSLYSFNYGTYTQSRNDLLKGGGGNDYVRTQSSGNSTLKGGAGDDRLSSNIGNHLLRGNAGNDLLVGGLSGNCTLVGGAGNDTLDTGVNDYVVGGAGNDLILSSWGYDTLTGGTGADRFSLFGFDPRNEYITITDFRRAQGDKIQISGSASNFSVDQSQNLSGQLALDTAIYYNNLLIAVLQDTTLFSLSLDVIFG